MTETEKNLIITYARNYDDNSGRRTFIQLDASSSDRFKVKLGSSEDNFDYYTLEDLDWFEKHIKLIKEYIKIKND